MHTGIIFFDGVCGLCNRFIDRLLRIDKSARFRYAPLQGTTAQEMLPAGMANALQSVIYLRHGKMLQRSDAALRILIDLGGWRRIYGVLYLLPRGLRDVVYRWIASNRYRWFGKRDTCRMPTQAERDRFLP